MPRKIDFGERLSKTHEQFFSPDFEIDLDDPR